MRNIYIKICRWFLNLYSRFFGIKVTGIVVEERVIPIDNINAHTIVGSVEKGPECPMYIKSAEEFQKLYS